MIKNSFLFFQVRKQVEPILQVKQHRELLIRLHIQLFTTVRQWGLHQLQIMQHNQLPKIADRARKLQQFSEALHVRQEPAIPRK